MKDQSDKSEPKLCPFRPDTGIQYNPCGQNIGSWVMFSECLEDKCAMWRLITAEEYLGPYTHGYCGLSGRP